MRCDISQSFMVPVLAGVFVVMPSSFAQPPGEIRHLVDISAVACPKVDPQQPDYTLSIPYTGEIFQDSVYIVSFLRSSNKAINIEFSIEDVHGDIVVPSTPLSLGELSDTVSTSCRCTNYQVDEGVAQTFGAGYGSACNAWDQAQCPQLWGAEKIGAWCCAQWCYADPSCPDAFPSQVASGISYSYGACPSPPPPSTCPHAKPDPCACKYSGLIFNAGMKSKFASNYGSYCKTWDLSTCAVNYEPTQLDIWCCQQWCYVDQSCPTSIASLNPGMEGRLFWTTSICSDDPVLLEQCPFKPSGNSTGCECLGSSSTMPTLALPAGAAAGYGTTCAAHDATICNVSYPGAQHDIWCCRSWCWVGPNCATKQASVVWPADKSGTDHYFSYDGCNDSAPALTTCKYNTTVCQCINSTKAAPGKRSNYGSSCSAWDSVGCYAMYGTGQDSTWGDNNSDQSWCCDNWCYVSPECPLAESGIYGSFSYDVCTDPSTAMAWQNSSDTCVPTSTRRLTGLGQNLPPAQSQHTVQGDGQPYRVSLGDALHAVPRRGKGRGGGGRYSGSSRSRSGPSYSPRRRAPPPTRRRAPPPPSAARRRAATVSGAQPKVSARRREPASTAGSHRRRRQSPNVPYGYGDKTSMMGAHGNRMPQRTGYGYSGYQSVPPYQRSQMSTGTAFAAGAAGGLFIGYWATRSMYVPVHRRRTSGEYCFAPSGDRQGDIMECYYCRRKYGACPSERDCRESQGCGYTSGRAYNRDDLTETGFVPRHFTPPLTVKFQSITGTDITGAGKCPPTSQAEYEIWNQSNPDGPIVRADLFLVLTKQDVMTPVTASSAHSFPRPLDSSLNILFGLLMILRFITR